MGKIALEGAEFIANHGFYEEERLLENVFVVDIYVETDFLIAAKEDNLYKTVNYEVLYKIAQEVMKIPVDLLEHLLFKIKERFESENFQNVQSLTIRISKKDVPMSGKINRVFVEEKFCY